MDRLTNIELLLMVSEDLRAQGDDLISEQNEANAAHARRVVELLRLLDKAYKNLEQERQRFSHYLPREEMPKAVKGGLSGTDVKQDPSRIQAN